MRPLALALDTSTPVLSCALLERLPEGVRVLATRQVGPPAVTSTLVPGLFDELLAEAGRAREELGVLVTGLGPGLFTGARVTVGTMKAVAYALSLPLVGAGSLEAMALAAARGKALEKGEELSFAGAPDSPLLCPVLDARKGEVYFALCRLSAGQLEVIAPPTALPPAKLAERLVQLGEEVRLFGTGLAPLAKVLPEEPRFVRLAQPETPGAAEIAWWALRASPQPAFDLTAVLALEPTYLRPPEAEVARKKRETEGKA